MRRIEISHYQIGIRYRRFTPPAPITRRPWHRACTLRTDMQDAARIDATDRTTARTQADNVEAVERQPVPADAATADQRWFARYDQADIGAGATHVERNQIVAAQQLRRVTTAGNTARGTRQHTAGRKPGRLCKRRHPAVR